MRQRITTRAFWIIVAVLFILGFWAFVWEPSRLTVVHRTIAIRPWHPEHVGLRVAVMSDLHVGSPYWGPGKLDKIVAVTNAEKPDLVLILGDFVVTGIAGGRFV